jgi:7-carboxy-7-deazaguanine synthase
MRITEIFFSIQGESTHAGEPCAFVRLTGCSLRCGYCDTKYSYAGGIEMSLEDVLNKVAGYPVKLVEVTGGEPLEQEAVYPLMQSLLDRDYTVMLETGGHVSIANVPKPVIKIIDIKCPDSREGHTFHWANIELAQPHDEFKLVISSRTDYDWSKSVFLDTMSYPRSTLRDGFLMMDCRCVSSFNCTSTSGARTCEGSDPFDFLTLTLLKSSLLNESNTSKIEGRGLDERWDGQLCHGCHCEPEL